MAKSERVLSRNEAERLIKSKIRHVEDLRLGIGEKFAKGIDNVSRDTKVDRKQLIRLLAASGTMAAEIDDESMRTRFRLWRRRIPFLFKQNWLETTVMVMILMLVSLFLRAVVRPLSLRLGLYEGVPIAARNLDDGHMLQSDDYETAWLPSSNVEVKSGSELKGLVLSQSVLRQKPFRFEDLLRLQVIAVKDIAKDDWIKDDDVTLGWSAYNPKAEIDIKNVRGRKTSEPVHSGYPILSEVLE